MRKLNRPTMLMFGCCLLGATALAMGVESRGARGCDSWLEHRLEQADGHGLSTEIDQTWMVGYLSGLVAGSGIDVMVGTDNGTLFAMVDAYCQPQPNADLAAAGTSVARRLMREKGIGHVPTLR